MQRSRRSPPAVLLALAVLAACDGHEAADADRKARSPEIARIAPAQEAIGGADVPTLDPATMSRAEIDSAIGSGPRCEFRYTSGGKPVVGVSSTPAGPSSAVVKVNGLLVVLRPDAAVSAPDARAAASAPDAGAGVSLSAAPVRILVVPERPQPADGEAVEATVIFEVDGQLRVGYRGYYGCTSSPRAGPP